MRDNKFNYLFKRARKPNDPKGTMMGDLAYDDGDAALMPEWNKYMPYFKFNEIFLDNKLEELLSIFGRRQCKSCIEFSTGQELEEDPRKVRSWPLSPRAEELYQGIGAEFDIVDFQLEDNVYHDT
jgi:hypothetical protein